MINEANGYYSDPELQEQSEEEQSEKLEKTMTYKCTNCKYETPWMTNLKGHKSKCKSKKTNVKIAKIKRQG